MKTFTDYCKDLVEENIDEHEGRRNRIYDNRENEYRRDSGG